MNVEIGTEATQFQEKYYIIGVFVAVHITTLQKRVKNYLEPLKNKCIFYSAIYLHNSLPRVLKYFCIEKYPGMVSCFQINF